MSALCGGTRLVGRAVRRCPVCGERRRIVEYWAGPWWGSHWTCCGCGDSWADGQIMERPFRRGWRQEAIRRARVDWEQALPREQFREAVRADIQAGMATEVRDRVEVALVSDRAGRVSP